MNRKMKVVGISMAALLGTLALALAISSVYQLVASRRAARNYAPPGKLVDVGGYRLHFDCAGGGEPTIVLEAGGGHFSLSWRAIQQSLVKLTGARVCSYDRAGLGWSEENPGPYSIGGEVEALHRGLAALGVSGKLVLVGHSYGGFLTRLYASRFSRDVVGLVLVDPNTVTFFERHPRVVDDVLTQSRLLRVAAPLGLVRLLAAGEFRASMRLPNPKDNREMLDLALTTKHLRSQAKMLSRFRESVSTMQSLDPRIEIPLRVLSRGKADASFPWGDATREADWRAGHAQLVSNATQGALIVADKSDHMILFDQPALVVNAVRDVVNRASVSGVAKP